MGLKALNRGKSFLGLNPSIPLIGKPKLNAGSDKRSVVSVHCLLVIDLSLPLLAVFTGYPRKRDAPDSASRCLGLLDNWRGASYHGGNAKGIWRLLSG